MDESLIVGDHYFAEALVKLARPERRRLLDTVGPLLAGPGG